MMGGPGLPRCLLAMSPCPAFQLPNYCQDRLAPLLQQQARGPFMTVRQCAETCRLACALPMQSHAPPRGRGSPIELVFTRLHESAQQLPHIMTHPLNPKRRSALASRGSGGGGWRSPSPSRRRRSRSRSRAGRGRSSSRQRSRRRRSRSRSGVRGRRSGKRRGHSSSSNSSRSSSRGRSRSRSRSRSRGSYRGR